MVALLPRYPNKSWRMSDPGKGERNPGRHESCPTRAVVRENMRVARSEAPRVSCRERHNDHVAARHGESYRETQPQTYGFAALTLPLGHARHVTVTL
jgi:hypothetical protein